VMWMVPRARWGEYDRRAVVQPLDLDREVARYGTGPGSASERA